MKRLIFVLLTLLSININADQKVRWEVEFGWRSNWRSNKTLSINSSGKMKSIQFSPYEEKFCNENLDF